MRLLRWGLASLLFGAMWAGTWWLMGTRGDELLILALVAPMAYFVGRWHEHWFGADAWWLERLRD